MHTLGYSGVAVILITAGAIMVLVVFVFLQYAS
jgi:hypothetical protein